ncbi:FAD-linked oxidase C-terminal domain-containing protein [Amphibiibacter pelophylacis]|uniref:FAD-linked oxidase C-terminal domain-containing protein n=1 Tax=Amphibiibacter pelophylacis TaxID=1799477 RepID=A0ACC6P0K7_9BURK
MTETAATAPALPAADSSRASPHADAAVLAGDERAQRQKQIVKALAAVLPAHALLASTTATTAFENDGLTLFRQPPLAVALPETEAQVQAVLKVCSKLDVPVVARGAGTGLSGGATPHGNGVVLSLAKFRRIVGIDAQARTATVQCGVRNVSISQAAAAHGLFYAPDPSSQLACTIGGNIAENAGGVHCLKYGLTLHNVMQVRGYTIDGEPITLGSLALDAPGFDLLPLIVGSEGLLMVIVEATVRLLPRPAEARCLLASFHTVRQAGDAVAAIIAQGIIPAGLEMMDQAMTAAVDDFVQVGYDRRAAAILLCESDGSTDEVDDEIERMTQVLQDNGAYRIVASSSEAQRLQFWKGRKNAFPASGRISPDYICMDSTIPRHRLADMLEAIAAMQERYQLRCSNVFHAGDGNLHPLILFDGSDPDQLLRAQAFGDEILHLSVAMGGTVTGEHGVGLEKLGAMCAQFDADTLAQMHAIKRAFDEPGLLNPGKAVPTLSRCAEAGRMHVTGGALPHPELERF